LERGTASGGGPLGCGVVVGIPAFNEEKNIGPVVVEALRRSDLVLVCDDGSTDLTGEIAGRLGARVLRHERNMGYGESIATLFREARRLGAEVLVTIDGDGQHDPREIPLLVDGLRSGGADISVGSRFLNGGDSTPGWRRLGIRLINGLVSNGGLKVSDSQSGFRAYGRRALELLELTDPGMGVSTEILVKARERGLRVAEVPIHVSYGKDSSTQNPLVHGLDVVVGTVKYLSTRRPLLFYGVPGFMAMVVALVFFVWTFQVFQETRSISTNLALMALGATMVGLMLMTTAIILWVITSVLKRG